MAALIFSAPDAPIGPGVKRPFAVFLDADDDEWRSEGFLRSRCLGLLELGCVWFECFGEQSEEVHDRLDDVIVQRGIEGVVTTYHCDESAENAVAFFRDVVLIGMAAGLIMVRERPKWMALF